MSVFEPLPAGHFIRLIELHPGNPQSFVVVTFEVFKLEEAPDYDALSYVWGNPETKGSSLTTRLRHESHTVLLWIDAICIDQCNDDERSSQVAFMGEIDRSARRVYAHIPGRHRSLKECLDVQELVEEVKRRVAKFGGLSKMRKSENARLKGDEPLINDCRWGSVKHFLNEDWFDRAWVLQEVAVARNPHVLYGQCEFSYRDFTLLCHWLTFYAAQIHGRWKLTPSLPLSALDWYCEDRTESPASPAASFIDLFNVSSYKLCKDSRDHIYSLLYHPLAWQQDGSAFIKPDYSMPVEDIYYEFACKIVQQPEGLRLLGTIDNGEDDAPRNLPSWVPRWKDPTRPRGLCFAVGVCPRHPFNSSNGLVPGPVQLKEDRTLSLHGIHFDQIHSVFTIKTPKHDFGPNLSREFESMYSEMTARESPYRSTIDRLDAFSITLTTGFLSRQEEFGLDQLKVHRANFDAFWKAGTNRTLYPDNNLVGSAESFLADIRERFPNGCVFITRKGYIGYGGAFARRGDHCVIFQGGFAPFIVRRLEETGTFRLVSEGYVHGIMRGEVASMVQAKEFEINEIILS